MRGSRSAQTSVACWKPILTRIEIFEKKILVRVSRKATAKILVSLWVSPKATEHSRNVGSIVLRSMVFIPTIPVLRNIKMLNNFVCCKKLKVEMASSACLAVIVVAASMNQSCVLRRAKYPEPLAEGYQTVNS